MYRTGRTARQALVTHDPSLASREGLFADRPSQNSLDVCRIGLHNKVCSRFSQQRTHAPRRKIEIGVQLHNCNCSTPTVPLQQHIITSTPNIVKKRA